MNTPNTRTATPNPNPWPSSCEELELTTRNLIACSIQLDNVRERPGSLELDLDEVVNRVCLASRLWRYVRYPEDFSLAAAEQLEAVLEELTGEDRP